MRRLILAAAVLTFGTACFDPEVASFHALFGDAELVLEHRLLGDWGEKDDSSDAADLSRMVIFRTDTTSRTYAVAWADSATAAVLPNIDFSLFNRDSLTLARLAADPALRGRHARDSVAYERITGRSEGKEVRGLLWQGRVGRLGGDLFLDLVPARMDREGKVTVDWGTLELIPMSLPVHTFFHVSVSRDSLMTRSLDSDWIRRQLDARSLRIAHERDVENPKVVLLTAKGPELRRALARWVKDSEAFTNQSISVRR